MIFVHFSLWYNSTRQHINTLQYMTIIGGFYYILYITTGMSSYFIAI